MKTPLASEHYDARHKRMVGRIEAAHKRHERAKAALLDALTSCELAFHEECAAADQLEKFKDAFERTA